MVESDTEAKIYKQLVSFGLDKHGFYGLIYSPDNGANYKLLVGTQGRIFYPEDAQNFWPYLKPFVSSQLSQPANLTWDNIKGKPDVALKSDIPSLTGYAKLTDIPSLTGYLKQADLDGYAKKSDIPAAPDLSGYAKSDDLNSVKATADSALSNANKAQSTADANTKALAGKADKSALPDVTGFATHDEVTKAVADKATHDEVKTAIANAKVTIDQSNPSTNKKPSEYSEGFSYELKNVSDVGLDRSSFDSSVQQGTQGLLTTTVLQGYVRQRLEIVDSDRPLTFARNGTGDTWHDWELVTTWGAV